MSDDLQGSLERCANALAKLRLENDRLKESKRPSSKKASRKKASQKKTSSPKEIVVRLSGTAEKLSFEGFKNKGFVGKYLKSVNPKKVKIIITEGASADYVVIPDAGKAASKSSTRGKNPGIQMKFTPFVDMLRNA